MLSGLEQLLSLFNSELLSVSEAALQASWSTLQLIVVADQLWQQLLGPSYTG